MRITILIFIFLLIYEVNAKLRIYPMIESSAGSFTYQIIPLPHPSYTGIVINIPAHTLYYFKEGNLELKAPCTVGRVGFFTPTGTFKITKKIKDPWWFPPASLRKKYKKPIPPGPRNPLGKYWLEVSHPHIGIHGTNVISSIGRTLSQGCIRLYPKDIKKLYHLVNIGTPLTIIYSPYILGFSKEEELYLTVFPDIYKFGTAKNVEDLISSLEEIPEVAYIDTSSVTYLWERKEGIAGKIGILKGWSCLTEEDLALLPH